MPKLTITTAVILIALGLGSYFGTGRESITAMIPAFFGVVLGALGLLAMRPGLRKHAMHVALLLGLLGVIAPGMRIGKALTAEGDFEFSLAFGVQVAMCVICLLFVVAGVKSFISARRASV